MDIHQHLAKMRVVNRVTAVFLVIMFFWMINIGSFKAAQARHALRMSGIDVGNAVFTHISSGLYKSVYVSSEPIRYGDMDVTYWQACFVEGDFVAGSIVLRVEPLQEPL